LPAPVPGGDVLASTVPFGLNEQPAKHSSEVKQLKMENHGTKNNFFFEIHNLKQVCVLLLQLNAAQISAGTK
jgi:hypothetical protein